MAQRQALEILSSSIKRNYELKPGERGFIEGARFGGVNPPEVAKVLDRPVSTIYSTSNRAGSRHNFESRPRSGRPKHYTEREKRLII
jgi:transposase